MGLSLLLEPVASPRRPPPAVSPFDPPGQLRREAMLPVKAANDQWEASNRPRHDAACFRQNVLPGLQRFSLSDSAIGHRAVDGACSLIRRGRWFRISDTRRRWRR